MTPLLEFVGVRKLFPAGGGRLLHAVDGVDLSIAPGESLGVVGESGSGKSTVARLAARLIDPTEGMIHYEGRDIGSISAGRFARDPARDAIQLVFQSADDTLNPAYTVEGNIAVGMGGAPWAKSALERARYIAGEVGLAEELLRRKPHALSGGQKARAGLARALVRKPRVLILDEPTASLDVSVQAVVLRLIDELRRARGMSLMFVSHDLEVIRLMTDRVAVLYLGRVAEVGPVAEILERPRHPYTQALVAAIPGRENGKPLAGEPPSPIGIPSEECHFRSRCPHAEPRCGTRRPELRSIGTVGAGSPVAHHVACHVVAG